MGDRVGSEIVRAIPGKQFNSLEKIPNVPWAYSKLLSGKSELKCQFDIYTFASKALNIILLTIILWLINLYKHTNMAIEDDFVTSTALIFKYHKGDIHERNRKFIHSRITTDNSALFYGKSRDRGIS